ncbi:Protein STRUBBELIG-REPTOR FAMILY 6 [Ranunculus cassubicifolius]
MESCSSSSSMFWMLLCIILLSSSYVNGDTDQTDVSALTVMYSSLNSPSQLTGWSANGNDPCAQNWKGVTCSGSKVTELKLSGLGLSGSMGYQLANLASLTNLDMSNNNLGSQLPYQLPPNLQRLNVAGNQLSGSIPYSISLMTSLRYLNVSHNGLQGQISDMFSNLPSLTTMDLSFNAFTDKLPQSMGSLSSMNRMYLQNNQFTGPIDVLANLPLEALNVANNRFTGWIPNRLKNINSIQTDGNSWSSGPAPPPPPGTPPSSARPNPNPRSGGNKSPSNDGGGKKSGIGAGAIAGIIISLLVVGAVVAFFLLRKKKSRKPSSDVEKPAVVPPYVPVAQVEVKETKSVQPPPVVSTKTFENNAAMNLRPPPKSFDEDDSTVKPIVVKKTNTAPITATAYSVADLQMATGSFSVENLIGEGSVGRVYRAQFDDGKVLAVKKIHSSSLPNQSSEDFVEAVSNISRLHHPNVTELVGYCSEHGQNLLVYEFHKNGSLHDFLHLEDDYNSPLTWNTRVKIALGSARALEYLHEVCSPSVVHKNFKSANILLDTELNPHLSDCGLENFIPSADHQASDQNSSSGYSAPEVDMSGQYTLKSDVYSFGIVMLELLTGRKPFESSRSRSEQSLVRWATPQLHDIDSLANMVDPALKGLYPAKSLSRFADVVALCVQPEPEFRPPMSEVVQALVRLVQRANMSKRTVGEDRRTDESDIQETY